MQAASMFPVSLSISDAFETKKINEINVNSLSFAGLRIKPKIGPVSQGC